MLNSSFWIAKDANIQSLRKFKITELKKRVVMRICQCCRIVRAKITLKSSRELLHATRATRGKVSGKRSLDEVLWIYASPL